MPKTREIAKDTVGARLRTARKQKRMTLAAVGKQCGVTAQAVAQWEYGEAEPSIDTLCVLARVLEIKLSEVLGEETRSLGELADKLEEVIELMPRAKGVIVDVEQRTCAPHRGLYIVELREGDHAAIVGRVVWPAKL